MPFTKKNPEIPDLPKNLSAVTISTGKPSLPIGYFDNWPHKDIPESGIVTQVNVKQFEDFTRSAPEPAKSRLQKVLRDLKNGADTMVRGVGRSNTVSTNARSAMAAAAAWATSSLWSWRVSEGRGAEFSINCNILPKCVENP